MFDRIMSGAIILLSGAWLGMTIVVFSLLGDFQPRIDAAIEAVAIIEDAARNIEADMEILRNIADREECYANQGEWSDQYGCHLEMIE